MRVNTQCTPTSTKISKLIALCIIYGRWIYNEGQEILIIGVKLFLTLLSTSIWWGPIPIPFCWTCNICTTRNCRGREKRFSKETGEKNVLNYRVKWIRFTRVQISAFRLVQYPYLQIHVQHDSGLAWGENLYFFCSAVYVCNVITTAILCWSTEVRDSSSNRAVHWIHNCVGNACGPGIIGIISGYSGFL